MKFICVGYLDAVKMDALKQANDRANFDAFYTRQILR